MTHFRRTGVRSIVLPADSPRPLATAAAELAAVTTAEIIHRPHTGTLEQGDIVLVVGDAVAAYPKVAARLEHLPADAEWELVATLDNALVIAGRGPRNVCRTALGWIEDADRETDRLSTYIFAERFTMWDNSMNQMYRFSRGFDRRCHVREIARLGHTGVEINRYADPGGYHVRHRRFPDDSYAWYLSYAPALDAFVDSSLTRGIYPTDQLQANLDDLLEAAELARDYGLQPGFVCYEPRCVADEIFDRYPELRGSRTDHPGRSLQPRYSLDIANPRVLDHYTEMLTALMTYLPDLRYFAFWTQDSGSGIPFANKLYPGPNGSFLARSKTIEEMVADFTRTLAEAGKAINPNFEVIMEIKDEYTEDERRRITANLPSGVTLSHPVGGSLMEDRGAGVSARFVQDDRSMGVEPYGVLTISAGFDAEPIIGVPTPSLLTAKFKHVRDLEVTRIFTNGGTVSPPQCPYDINQELYSELIRTARLDLGRFLHEKAAHWCEGDAESTRLLVDAWLAGDDAIRSWCKLNWYHSGPGQTQARWLVRPLVPDITKLSDHERAAWQRALFTLPHDVGRANIAFESGVRFFRDEDLDRAVAAYDTAVIPRLQDAIGLLGRAIAVTERSVLVDQRDRYRGLLLRSKTDRNLFDAQVSINNWLLGRDDSERQRQRLKNAIRVEIDNTKDWLDALADSATEFFHVSTVQETPFLHVTPIEDFQLKLTVMQEHIDDEPGPYFEDLAKPKAELLFDASQG